MRATNPGIACKRLTHSLFKQDGYDFKDSDVVLVAASDGDLLSEPCSLEHTQNWFSRRLCMIALPSDSRWEPPQRARR